MKTSKIIKKPKERKKTNSGIAKKVEDQIDKDFLCLISI
jgi:hypothetical protein